MKEETHIECLKRMQEEGKIDVAFELERILDEEFRSATIGIIEDKDWTEEQKQQILEYKYKGKSALEWELEALRVTGFNEEGNPAWYEPHTNMIDALTVAKLLFLTEKQLKEN